MFFHERTFYKQFTLSELYVMRYTPKIITLAIDKRELSSFLFVVEGKYKYEYGDTCFTVCAGEAVYLPKNAVYSYTILSEKTTCIQVSFQLKCNNDYFEFSDHPLLIYLQNKPINRIFENIYEDFSENGFSVYSGVYELLSIISEAGIKNNPSPLRPAVEYLTVHFTNKIYIHELAMMCGLSESHFRRLFAKELGISPIKYKNRLLCTSALYMMRNEKMSVSQVAEALGFTDIYNFSQMFKKEMGMSPKKYLEKNYS